MTAPQVTWRFILKSHASQNIDASTIQRRVLVDQSATAIGALKLTADGRPHLVRDLFEVDMQQSAASQQQRDGDLIEISVAGEGLQHVHGLGSCHDQGRFTIHGNAGDRVGSGMTGGQVQVNGNVGDHAGGPSGIAKTGMRGGELDITGDAGDYTGHRMRRGRLMIEGGIGRFAAASMIAGTLVIGGQSAGDLGAAMKRGTVILVQAESFISQQDHQRGSRFTLPMRFDPHFLSLIRDRKFTDLTRPLRRLPVFRTRADRSVGGQGEIIFPASPAMI